MAQVTLTAEEAHVVAIFRAIKQVDHQLVDVEDVGTLIELLRSVVELDAEAKDLTQKEVKQLLKGFVLGVASLRQAELVANGVYYPIGEEDEDFEVDPDTPIGGGPSNTIVAGQGTDPGYVTQSGVRAEPKGE